MKRTSMGNKYYSHSWDEKNGIMTQKSEENTYVHAASVGADEQELHVIGHAMRTAGSVQSLTN